MRRPRDIDAELKALQEKTKGLKARQRTQLGELVIATGADAFDLETLAGILLAAIDEAGTEAREGWRRRGHAFFQRRARRSASGASDAQAGADGNSGGTAPLGSSSETG